MADVGSQGGHSTEYWLQLNELVFAHKVRGLLAVLHDHWTDSDPPKKLSDYILGFHRRLSVAWDLAKKRKLRRK